MKFILLSFILIGDGQPSQMAVHETKDCQASINQIVSITRNNQSNFAVDVVKMDEGVYLTYRNSGTLIRQTLLCTESE